MVYDTQNDEEVVLRVFACKYLILFGFSAKIQSEYKLAEGE